MSTQPKTTYLKDYKPTHYIIDSIFLHVDIMDDKTIVKSILNIRRRAGINAGEPLILDGDELTLTSVALDGKLLEADQFQVTSQQLSIPNVPDVFILETVVDIFPKHNMKLMGIYQSGDNYASQCESHGFRRITYFLDRPDILTHFTTTITADKTRYPTLLSNGNLVDQKDLSDNRHWVKWEDPSLKPCYLFALVAGDFDQIEDSFMTQSNRHIKLEMYVEKGKKDQAYHAMNCLKRAMKWDEETFGREYDLDQYMIVSVNDFNFGAMENKGLNIFNDCYILAKPSTATDQDYLAIETVVGHEYFHNWSGNRITVNNWFQITLKEGLTVFRDQSFTEDVIAGISHRIDCVKSLRNAQFPQDAGPMAHPIRPEHYIEINNFYTATVYSKGAEVIRMIQTLLGKTAFRCAMDLYFSRNDGKAVATEDFVQAMEDSSGVDLTQFKHWYSQAGTPVLDITDDYDADTQTYTLTIKQSCPKTPADIGDKKPFHIPIAFGLLDETGNEIEVEDDVLEVKKSSNIFTFKNIPHKPIPSLLRHFSAPVKIHYDYTDDDLIHLMQHDTDAFNRWDAMQSLMILAIKKQIQQDAVDDLIGKIAALLDMLLTSNTDPILMAEMLTLPSEHYLLSLFSPIEPDQLHKAYQQIKTQLATTLESTLRKVYSDNKMIDQTYCIESIGKRKLKNQCLSYLVALKTPKFIQLAHEQFNQAENMTDKLGALSLLVHIDCSERTQALEHFYQTFKNEALVLDKWFGLQGKSDLPDVFEQVKALMQHPQFDIKNPNRARALIGNFCANNPVHFHNLNGEGYQFLVNQLISIDKINPMVAGRLIEPLTQWRKFDAKRQTLMKKELERLAAEKNLSNDLYEIVTKSLNDG